jgi:amino acid permease
VTTTNSNRTDQELKLKQDEFDLKGQEFDLKRREFDLKQTEHWLTIFGFVGTAVALVFGFYQYLKAEQWKQAEFLSKEMKEFFANRDVRN